MTVALVPSCSRTAVRPNRRAALAGMFGLGVPSMPALALVTGSKPPEGGFKAKKAKCKNIDECEALGEKAADQKYGGEETSFERTSGGDRFRDLRPGEGKKAEQDDAVEIRYRVMRLGTRARDGLSGEGQTIFSYGYGEDEDKEGDTLVVQLDGKSLVEGADAAIIGMQPGGRRRVLVRPERGWKLQTGACTEGEKSLDLTAAKRTVATDGNLVFKADIGAAIDNVDACQDKVKAPQPRTYGQRQRFARRFDESLMMEIDLVAFSTADKARKQSGQYYDKCEQNPFADGCDG
eukprot:CAMPEP_0119062876 /NCGR_PEP_ID=MMETSP1178-20130426/6362_1 /TAXON_ID=33656 /ORGANISM="unid sp, Strain CCMP2000" /LENGTH=291 /DNA_ID=CAMNT_0007044189 /DNA_START=63 /DNA_END=938 /DNA_ORIENTATION=-